VTVDPSLELIGRDEAQGADAHETKFALDVLLEEVERDTERRCGLGSGQRESRNFTGLAQRSCHGYRAPIKICPLSNNRLQPYPNVDRKRWAGTLVAMCKVRRVRLLLGIAIALTWPASAFAGGTQLQITVWKNGLGVGTVSRQTLACTPAGGTLPNPGAACRRLMLLHAPFARVPPGVACSDLFAGPQVAVVTGAFRGRHVYATFRRTDSCETDRWSRVGFLFPGALASH
jgi:hypothetical protein